MGAGAAGVMAVREIRSRGEHDMDLRGFVDDDPAKQGAVISGLRVLGPTESLPVLVPALGIDQVIITIADVPQAQLRRILKICEGMPAARPPADPSGPEPIEVPRGDKAFHSD